MNNIVKFLRMCSVRAPNCSRNAGQMTLRLCFFVVARKRAAKVVPGVLRHGAEGSQMVTGASLMSACR